MIMTVPKQMLKLLHMQRFSAWPCTTQQKPNHLRPSPFGDCLLVAFSCCLTAAVFLLPGRSCLATVFVMIIITDNGYNITVKSWANPF